MKMIDHTKTMKYCTECQFWYRADSSCDCELNDETKRLLVDRAKDILNGNVKTSEEMLDSLKKREVEE